MPLSRGQLQAKASAHLRRGLLAIGIALGLTVVSIVIFGVYLFYFALPAIYGVANLVTSASLFRQAAQAPGDVGREVGQFPPPDAGAIQNVWTSPPEGAWAPPATGTARPTTDRAPSIRLGRAMDVRPDQSVSDANIVGDR